MITWAFGRCFTLPLDNEMSRDVERWCWRRRTEHCTASCGVLETIGCGAALLACRADCVFDPNWFDW